MLFFMLNNFLFKVLVINSSLSFLFLLSSTTTKLGLVQSHLAPRKVSSDSVLSTPQFLHFLRTSPWLYFLSS